MTSLRNTLPAQYRERAREAREKAEAATDEATRSKLLNDAELWERMAEYEEASHAARNGGRKLGRNASPGLPLRATCPRRLPFTIKERIAEASNAWP